MPTGSSQSLHLDSIKISKMQAPIFPLWFALARAERLPIIWLTALAGIFGLAWFAGSLALVETLEMRLTILGGGGRLLADIVMVLFPVLAVARLRESRLWLVWRAAPAGPWRLLFAATIALWLMAGALAVSLCPLLIVSGAGLKQAAVFSFGLWLEAGLVGQMALTLSSALRGPMTGVTAGLAALLLGRLAGLFSGAVIGSAGMATDQLYSIASLIVPRLDLYAPTAVLTASNISMPMLAILQAPAYAALFLAIGVIDGMRR